MAQFDVRKVLIVLENPGFRIPYFEPVVPVVQGQVITVGNYPPNAQESRSGFRGIFSETQA